MRDSHKGGVAWSCSPRRDRRGSTRNAGCIAHTGNRTTVESVPASAPEDQRISDFARHPLRRVLASIVPINAQAELAGGMASHFCDSRLHFGRHFFKGWHGTAVAGRQKDGR